MKLHARQVHGEAAIFQANELMVGEFDAAPRPMEEVYSVLHGKGVAVELAYY